MLEDANVKPASMATDVLGASGRNMLEALITGESDPAERAESPRKRLGEKMAHLPLALEGRVTYLHRFLLRMHLDHVAPLEKLIARLSARIDEKMAPFAGAKQKMETIPGVNQRVAETVVAEIGVNMKQIPSANHLAS